MGGKARHYSELARAPVVTADSVHELAQAALRALAHRGERNVGGPMDGDFTWVIEALTQHGAPLRIACSGPDLPDAIPGETIRPADVGRQMPWAGVYRLTVTAPLPVFDLYWKPGEPLRILQFSRGDWEADVRKLAP